MRRFRAPPRHNSPRVRANPEIPVDEQCTTDRCYKRAAFRMWFRVGPENVRQICHSCVFDARRSGAATEMMGGNDDC